MYLHLWYNSVIQESETRRWLNFHFIFRMEFSLHSIGRADSVVVFTSSWSWCVYSLSQNRLNVLNAFKNAHVLSLNVLYQSSTKRHLYLTRYLLLQRIKCMAWVTIQTWRSSGLKLKDLNRRHRTWCDTSWDGSFRSGKWSYSFVMFEFLMSLAND